MKKKIGKYAAAVIFILASFNAFSQSEPHRIPAWVSDKGYWVVENNLHQPLQQTIRFYNNENIMIGTKDISGRKLNLKKRKTKMQLKSMLESSLLEWARTKTPAGNADLANQP